MEQPVAAIKEEPPFVFDPEPMDLGTEESGSLAGNLRDERSWMVDCILGEGDESTTDEVRWNPFPINTREEFDALDFILSRDSDKCLELVSYAVAIEFRA